MAFNSEYYLSFLNKTTNIGGAGTDSQPRRVTYYSAPTQTTSTISAANPAIITHPSHGFTDQQSVFFTNSDSGTSINGLQTITVIDANSYSVAVNNSGGPAGTTAKVYDERFIIRDIVIDSYDENGDPLFLGNVLVDQRLNIGEGKFEFIKAKVGNIPEKFSMIGYSRNVSSNSYSFLNPEENPFDFSTSASTIDVVSTSLADAISGTGASSIHIYGLDASFAEISEELFLTGMTPVTPSTNSYLRINKVQVGDLANSNPELGTTNTGDIIITRTGGGEHMAIIPSEEGSAQLGFVTIPAGKTWCLSSINIYSERSREIEVRVMVRENLAGDGVSGPKGPYILHKSFARDNISIISGKNTEFHIPERSDVFILAKQKNGSNNGELSVTLIGELFKN